MEDQFLKNLDLILLLFYFITSCEASEKKKQNVSMK